MRRLSKSPYLRQFRVPQGESLESRQCLSWDPESLTGIALEAPTSNPLPPYDGISQVAAAHWIDLDADGDDDLVYSRTQTKFIWVSLTEGPNQMAEPVAVSVAAPVLNIHSADFNGDQVLDLLLSSESQITPALTRRSLTSWEGFTWVTPINASIGQLATGDVDRDGQIDLALGQTGGVEVRRGLGGGRFEAPIGYVPGAGNRTVALGDLDGDQAPELIVELANTPSNGGKIIVLHNDGGGIFETTTDSFAIGDRAQTIRLIDLDGDTQRDLVIGHSNQEGGNLSVWTGHGDGTFDHVATRYETLGSPREILWTEITQDGRFDLVVRHEGTFHHPINGNGPGGVSILPGRGDGRFGAPVRTSIPTPIALTARDVDADGDIDLRVLDYANIILFRNTVRSTFPTEATRYQDLEFGYGITRTGDLNSDGELDVAIITQIPSAAEPEFRVTILWGSSTGELIHGSEWTEKGYAIEAKIDNLDSDASHELLLLTSPDVQFHHATVWELATPNSFVKRATTPLGAWSLRATADVNRDGRLDLLGAHGDDQSLRILTADDVGLFQPTTTLANSRNWYSVQLLDLNHDQTVDILAIDNQQVIVLLGDDLGGFTQSYARAMESVQYVVGDFNGDTHLDLALYSYNSAHIQLAYGNGQGAFPTEHTTARPAFGYSLFVNDVNGDGRADLLATSQYDLSIALSQGIGFAPFVRSSLAHGVGAVFLEDFDRDGMTDILALPDGIGFFAIQAQATLLHGDATNAFARKTSYSFPSVIAPGITAVDLSDDGDVDILFPTGTGILVWTNTASQRVPGDFDGDGQRTLLDIDLLCRAVRLQSEIQRFDLNSDSQLNAADVDYLLSNLLQSTAGDVNLDRRFDSSDLVKLFQIGEYEDEISHNSDWSEGDLNCDGDFSTADLVHAFQAGGYLAE